MVGVEHPTKLKTTDGSHDPPPFFFSCRNKRPRTDSPYTQACSLNCVYRYLEEQGGQCHHGAGEGGEEGEERGEASGLRLDGKRATRLSVSESRKTCVYNMLSKS